MNWKRDRPGVYTAGPYLVERNTFGWRASGPGLGEQRPTKLDAQQAATKVAKERILGSARTCQPYIGDHVKVDQRKGQIGTSQLASGELLYCIRFARGKRLCLFRHEFEVVLP